jgi:hypothetical protein
VPQHGLLQPIAAPGCCRAVAAREPLPAAATAGCCHRLLLLLLLPAAAGRLHGI